MKLTRNEWLRDDGRRVMEKPGMAVLLAIGLLGAALAHVAGAQAVSTTTVQGTVYLANGHPGSGTLHVSWPAFTTAAQASLGQVQAQVMPAAQAVQTVSKSYVDRAITELTQSVLTAFGGSLSGPLYLNGDPTQPLQVADMHNVDAQVATAVPLAGGSMTGALATPAVNGVESPTAGSSKTTLQAAMNAAGTNGAMLIPPGYAGTDGFTNPNGVRVTDLRKGAAQPTEQSVKEFGAVCDGATDDTTALQSALNYANAHGVALTIPQGTCKTRALNWHGESIGGLGKQVSALKGFPGQDVLVTRTDSTNLLSNTRVHDLTIYVDQSLDVSCSPAEARAAAGSCAVNRPMENNSIFSQGSSGLSGTTGTGAGWSVGNCAIAMPAVTGVGGNGLQSAAIENVTIATTGTDPLAAQYPGAHSTHTCGLYLAQWPQWSEFRNININGLNTGIAIPALPATTPAGLTADANRWQNIKIQATHGFTAAAGSNNVLDNLVEQAGNSSATGETPTGLVLDLSGSQQGWTVRNAVVAPSWVPVQPQLAVTAAGGAVTGITVGPEHGLGFHPYGTQVPLAFSGSCSAAATASVNSDGSIGTVSVTQGGVGCSGTTTASVNAARNWDTAAAVNLIGGQDMALFGGNLLKGNGGYTVWNASGSQTFGTQLDGGGGTLPGGGSYTALVSNSRVGAALQVDQFPGADFGAKLQACLNAVSAQYGGTCDARNFVGNQTMGSSLTISTGNTTVQLPCATIATAKQILVTAGTRNVSCDALRGGSQASGNQGGTVLEYSGTGAMVQVGDPTYASDTQGFHLDNVVINTTASASATAQGLVAYRTQELDLQSLYFLGNANQTGMTLDGTGNYTGGTFYDNDFSGFQKAVNAIGHQAANAATTDWMNASTFVRLHIDCPTSSGNPVSGTVGINLAQGDGNTITGGDVEGCDTALHLGANAQNNTVVGLRNENSNNQVVADQGSSYNDWITGGAMYTGKLTDNGTRNSFQDTFHRSFKGLNGDWYGSQKDATVTNHWRLGTGNGNERGLLNEIQTDYGYRWEEGLEDGTSGEQLYAVTDLLNIVPRVSIGQYLSATPNTVTNVILEITTAGSTNNQTVTNSKGSGAVVLNGSNDAGTGGVVIGSGGPSGTTVATINSAGNAQFNGTLGVSGASTFSSSTRVKNQADAEIDQFLWAGATTSHKESFIYKDWNGSSQWYMVKDASNNWALNSATGGLDSFKAYQSANSGDTYINASNSSGVVRVNYETGAGTGFKVYGGSSNSLYASFTGATAIQFPGLAASTGYNCLQVDNSGFVTNTGAACGSGSGLGSGKINTAAAGQIAYYSGNGTAIGGLSAVPLTAGGTGSSTAAGALQNLGGISSTATAAQTTASPLSVPVLNNVYNADLQAGADCGAKINAADALLGSADGEIDVTPTCGTTWTTQVVLRADHNLKFKQAGIFVSPGITLTGSNVIDLGGSTIQIAGYTTGTAGLFTLFNGSVAANNVRIENGILDGNMANTPSANNCLFGQCRAAISLSNNNVSTAVHDITAQNVLFQNWNNPAIYSPQAVYPLPYNISILNSTFNNFGTNVIVLYGYDHNLAIRGNTFKSWGVNLTAANSHADPIITFDLTGYAGTSMFDVDVSNNIFDNTTISTDGYGFVSEFNGGGFGWTTNFTFSDNHLNDDGTNYGGLLSGGFKNAAIEGNVWTTQGPAEVIGTNITLANNSITNGSIVLGPSLYAPSQGNTITGNTISIPGLIGPPGTGVNQKAIYIGGDSSQSATLTQAIRQSAQSFTQSGGTLSSITFTPRNSANVPPEIVVTGVFSGGASNGFQNWAFTLAGATNGGNDGTFICAASTGTTMTFVDPFGVSETLPAGATLTSSANTTAYVGTYPFGSFNGLTGQQNLNVSGFTNAGNNSTTLTAIANSVTVVATTNPNGVNETNPAALSFLPSLSNTIVSDNSINLFGSSGSCAGIFVGFGDGGVRGPFYNLSVEDNNISANSALSNCAAVELAGAYAAPFFASSGLEIRNNSFSNIGFGVWGNLTAATLNDVTIVGNKMSNVTTPIAYPTPPSVLRVWDNVNSSTQTVENLNGGVTVDPSGNIANASGVLLPSTLTGYHGNASGVKLPLATNWTNTAGAVVCDDGNGNLTISACTVNATKVNGGSLPASATRLATNASGQVTAAANTLGCLDGYDHLPCTVYVQSNVSESAATGSYATAWTSTFAGTYRVTGYIYGTTASSTAFTVSEYVKATQTGQSAGNGYLVGSAQVGTSISSGDAYSYVFPLGAGTVVQTESLGASGSNTGGVWSRAIVIERVQ